MSELFSFWSKDCILFCLFIFCYAFHLVVLSLYCRIYITGVYTLLPWTYWACLICEGMANFNVLSSKMRDLIWQLNNIFENNCKNYIIRRFIYPLNIIFIHCSRFFVYSKEHSSVYYVDMYSSYWDRIQRYVGIL